MPISAPSPNSPPSVKRVEALTFTTAESTRATKVSDAAREVVQIASVWPEECLAMWSIADSRSSTTATAISYTEIDNGSGFQDIPQVLGLNIYFGWYYHDLDTLGPWLDALHAKHPMRPIFISEYGSDHDERVRAKSPVAFDFSAEYQQRFHERSFAQMRERPWLAGTAVWNHFDFGSNGRQDSKFGINQKGLQYYDRRPKDILYYYRAMMLPEPVLRIAAHEWTRRAGSRAQDATQAVTVYANVDEVELLHNGASLGKLRPDNAVARFSVSMIDGDNRLLARGVRDGKVVEDEVVVAYRDRAPFFHSSRSDVSEIAVNAGGHYDVVDGDGVGGATDYQRSPPSFVLSFRTFKEPPEACVEEGEEPRQKVGGQDGARGAHLEDDLEGPIRERLRGCVLVCLAGGRGG